MRIHLYSNPKGAGWLGWIEDCKKRVIAFVQLDGSLVWDW